MNAAELIDKVVDIYKKSFWMQIAFAAIAYAIMAVGVFILTFILAIIMLSATTAFGSEGNSPDNYFLVVFGLVLIVTLPLGLLWHSFLSSGHILLSRQAFYGYRVRLAQMGVFKVFLRVFTALLAQIIIAIPFIIVGIGVIVAFAYSFENYYSTDVPAAGIISFLIIIFILVVGYFVFSNIFSLSVAVAAFERRYFFDTIVRSWQLVKTDFWRILGIRLIWYFVSMTVVFSAYGVLLLITLVWGLLAGSVPFIAVAGFFVVIITSYIGPMLINLVIIPLDGIMQSLIYFNQRMKNEGFDIELRLGKLIEKQANQ